MRNWIANKPDIMSDDLNLLGFLSVFANDVFEFMHFITVVKKSFCGYSVFCSILCILCSTSIAILSLLLNVSSIA